MKSQGSLETFEISLGRAEGFLDHCPVRKGTMGKSGPEMGPKTHPGREESAGFLPWAGPGGSHRTALAGSVGGLVNDCSQQAAGCQGSV